jgi:excinuclease UvrABC nuclease subunit
MNFVAYDCLSNLDLDWVGPLGLWEDEVDRVPPLLPGIYLLHVFDRSSGAYPVAYVGKTCDLRRRLRQHLESTSTTPEFEIARRHSALTRFSAAPCRDREALDRVEAGLILRLRPPFNRQVPRAIPLFTNLPPLTIY